jgi:hypothetical protein
MSGSKPLAGPPVGGGLRASCLVFASLQMAFACETNSLWLNGADPEAPLAPLAPVVVLLLPPPQPATASDAAATQPTIAARTTRLLIVLLNVPSP